MSLISFTWPLFTFLYFSNIPCIKSQNVRYLLSDESNRRLPHDVQINIFSMRFSLNEMITKYARSFQFKHVEAVPDPFIAEAILRKRNELTVESCIDLKELFYRHQDQMSKFDEDSMNQQLEKLVTSLLTEMITNPAKEMERAYNEKISQGHNINRISFVIDKMQNEPIHLDAFGYFVDATYLQKKHILDYLGIQFTLRIPDSCTMLGLGAIGFNADMLTAFTFGAGSQLKVIGIPKSQIKSLNYDDFGQYFPSNVREIHANSNQQLQGDIDLKGYHQLEILSICDTGITKVINIPRTMKQMFASKSTQLTMEDGSDCDGMRSSCTYEPQSNVGANRKDIEAIESLEQQLKLY